MPAWPSVRRFAGSTRDPLDIGRELGVEAVLTGTLARDADRLRLTPQLTRVADAHQVWSGSFEERFTGIFAVQDTMTELVAASLVPGLRSAGIRMARPATSDTEAY